MKKLYKLGKLPAKHDVRTLQLENYYSFPDPPEERIWSDKVSKYGMMVNNRLGDCGIAGPAHMIQAWTANENKEVIISDEDIIKTYSIISGYDPKTGLNDNGVCLLDVLKYWRTTGIAGHKIGAFMAVNPRNIRMVKVGINEFGGTLNGIALPISAQGQSRWDIPASFSGNGAPGSWGRHCTTSPDYLKSGDFVHITWGMRLPSSEKFDIVYTDEKYVILSPDFINDKKLSPANFNWDKMQEDMSHFS